ncbi:hypothetical protein, partial [Acidaminobacter sp.]|uniref:hypothetical protein n=1 Tax=Acidaminobacter sp. TaxID=1872102 RepID=UPI00256C154B
ASHGLTYQHHPLPIIEDSLIIPSFQIELLAQRCYPLNLARRLIKAERKKSVPFGLWPSALTFSCVVLCSVNCYNSTVLNLDKFFLE